MDPDFWAPDKHVSRITGKNNLGLKMSCYFHQFNINLALFIDDSQG